MRSKLYDTSDGVMRDLVAGRLDMAILDPPSSRWRSRSIPSGICTRWRSIPIRTSPIMSTKYNVVMGIRKDGTALATRSTREIANLWATCKNQPMMANYGVTDASFFVAARTQIPASAWTAPEGWKSPTLDPDCDANAVERANPATP